MTDLVDMMTHPRARLSDPATSHAAARSATFADAHRHSIIRALSASGSGTQYEIAEWAGLDHMQVNRRLIELERMGMVYRSDTTRPSPSGRACTVWCRA